MLRRWVLVVALALFGCESLRKPAPEPSQDPSPAAKPRDLSPSERGEVENHRATVKQLERPDARHLAPLPRGEVATACEARKAGEGAAITHATTAPPTDEPDPLTLVAECLERGDRVSAATHLETYVRLHPDQLMFRLQLAELLVRLGRDADAKHHYERFADDARHATTAVKEQLVHVHTRLMEIGQRHDDRFAEVFHRGVGLLLLVAEEDGKADRDAVFCEEMLCKALKSLAEAKEMMPGETRVCVYLAKAYERTGNRRAAEVELATARNAVVPGGAGLMLPRE